MSAAIHGATTPKPRLNIRAKVIIAPIIQTTEIARRRVIDGPNSLDRNRAGRPNNREFSPALSVPSLQRKNF
jgi:hypothetical protein